MRPTLPLRTATLLAATLSLCPAVASAVPLSTGATPVVSGASSAPPAAKTLAPATATVALSAIRLLLPILQVKAEAHLSPSTLCGGFLGWGSPRTDVIDEKTQVEAGAHFGWFPLGNRSQGLGAVGQLAFMRAWGRLGELKASSYGFSGTAFASGRWTFDNDTLIEAQYGFDYVYSYAGLEGGDAGSWEGRAGTRFNLWFGYSF